MQERGPNLQRVSAAYHPHSPLSPAVQETGPDGAPTSKADAVLWTFVFDPRLGCNHINLIDRHDGTLGGDANQVTPLEWRPPLRPSLHTLSPAHIIMAR